MAGSARPRWPLSPRRPSPWTGERLAQLRRRWSQGASARHIADELRAGISRSAVLAKIHRLGIGALSPFGGGAARRPRQAVAAGLQPAPTQPRPRLFRPRTVPRWIMEAKPYVDDPRRDAAIAPAQRCSLAALSEWSCRWPVGDPAREGFFFCGGERLPGAPYCAAHCARAHRGSAAARAARGRGGGPDGEQ
jgi:GcrA cell cycle regulator